ncbi:MAG: hypothetical protein ACK59B_14135 [Alphaproteobacteria bacterium]
MQALSSALRILKGCAVGLLVPLRFSLASKLTDESGAIWKPLLPTTSLFAAVCVVLAIKHEAFVSTAQSLLAHQAGSRR